MEQTGGDDKALSDAVRPAFVFIQGKPKHGWSLAIDSGSTVRFNARFNCIGASFPSSKQGNSLEEVRTLDLRQQRLLLEALDPFLPVIAEVEVVSGVGCGQ